MFEKLNVVLFVKLFAMTLGEEVVEQICACSGDVRRSCVLQGRSLLELFFVGRRIDVGDIFLSRHCGDVQQM